MSARIAVAVYRGHRLVGRRSFDGAIVTVGSAPGCALRFVGVPEIEASHALVWDDGGVLTIVPSTGASIALNGTVVSIARPGPDDVVSIGPLDLRFERRGAAEDADGEPTRVRPAPAPAPPETARDDRGEADDDEDEDAGFLEPFSLLDQVARSPGVAGGELSLQLVATRAGRLTELATIDRAAQYMPALPHTLARHGLDGTAELSFGPEWAARVRARARGALVQRPAGAGVVRFAVGGCAVLQDGERTVLAFFVRRPRLAPEIGRRGVAQAALRHGAAAFAVHLAAGLVLIGVVRPDAAMSAGSEPVPAADDGPELFAYPLEQPDRAPPPPPAAAAPEPAVRDEQPRAPGAPSPRAAAPSARPPARPVPSGARPATPDLDDALAALERSATAGPATGSLRDALGTIDVAASSGGSTPGYRVAGPIGLPGGPVGLGGRGRPGGAIVDVEGTLGGAAGVGRFVAPRPGGGEGVGGLVRDAGGGVGPRPTIDRAAVQRVINQHQHEVVRCYERALLGTPALAGTVRMGWTIAPGGSVASVQIQRSTVANSAVTTCIASAIRGWRFPSPQGGPVTITFPWVLRPASP